MDRNIFISPISIEIALAMTYNGAMEETQRAMAEAMSLKGLSLNEVNHANAEMLSALENLVEIYGRMENSPGNWMGILVMVFITPPMAELP